MTGKESPRERRSSDPYLDRRSGEERRKAYHLDYFSHGGTERRSAQFQRTTQGLCESLQVVQRMPK